MNNSIYLCYKRSLTSIIAASLVFEKLRNNGYAVIYRRKSARTILFKKLIRC